MPPGKYGTPFEDRAKLNVINIFRAIVGNIAQFALILSESDEDAVTLLANYDLARFWIEMSGARLGSYFTTALINR